MLYVNVSRPLAERMDARLVVPVSGGSRMTVDTSDMMGRVLATSGVWEPHVTAVVRSLLSTGDVSVDVGAHIGYHTLLASRLVGPSGRVYAFEPSVTAYAALRANVSLNAAANVTTLRMAAGASDGRALLVEPPPGNTGEASVRMIVSDGHFAGPPEPEEVAVRSVASVVGPQDARRLRLVKIDVEGFEPEVLRGVAGLFAEGHSPALVVEVHPGSARETVAALEQLRSTYALFPFELVRVPSDDRFAPVPPPRDLDLQDVERRCLNRTFNVLLLAERLTRARVGGRSS
jgi:FkbM family methyltransferase